MSWTLYVLFSLFLNIFINNFAVIRTFFSLNIKDNFVIQKISFVQEDLKLELRDYNIKWEEQSKFHLTLRFLGNTDEKMAQTLIQELDGYNFGFDKIIFETKGIGFFPNPKFPNVIFLELTEKENPPDGEAGNSFKLAEKIESAVNKYGFERDKRFIPHVTLGRFRKGKRKRMERIPVMKIESFKIEMDSFYLMKSIMDSKGSTYSVIKEFHFKNQ